MLPRADHLCVFVIIKKKSSCWLKLQAKWREGMIFDNCVQEAQPKLTLKWCWTSASPHKVGLNGPCFWHSLISKSDFLIVKVSTYFGNKCPKYWALHNVCIARYFYFKSFWIKIWSGFNKGQLFSIQTEAEPDIACSWGHALIVVTLLPAHVRMLPTSSEKRSPDVSYPDAIFFSIIRKCYIFIHFPHAPTQLQFGSQYLTCNTDS